MSQVNEICRRAAAAAPNVARLPAQVKDAALGAMADALEDAAGELAHANETDLDKARAEGTSKAVIDRLTLTDKRISASTFNAW